MPSQTRSPATIVNSGFIEPWVDPGNAAASDDLRAVNGILSAGLEYLKATNYGFSIPLGATIQGIQFDCERLGTGSFGGTAVDESTRLVKGGAISGDDKASPDLWPAVDGIKSYGGAADLWGLAWLPEDINSALFGVVLSAVASGFGQSAQVDHMPITVHYTEPPVIPKFPGGGTLVRASAGRLARGGFTGTLRRAGFTGRIERDGEQ